MEYFVAFGALYLAGVSNESKVGATRSLPPSEVKGILKKDRSKTPNESGYWRDDRVDGVKVVADWVKTDPSFIQRYNLKFTTDIAHQPYFLQQSTHQQFDPKYYDWKPVSANGGPNGEDHFLQIALSKRR